MKRILQIFFITLATGGQLIAQSDTLKIEAEATDADSVEYELLVLDPGYETFLLTQPPMEYYSLSYYKNWNIRYVNEWNYRYMNALQNKDLYEVYIDYNSNIEYGLELNYRLYYYFRFFEKENRVDLLPEKAF